MTSKLFIFVAGALTVIALVCLGGVIYLSGTDHATPDVLVATAGAAVGSLGTLLARTIPSGPVGGR